MRNLSNQEIINIAVDKFEQIKGHESCNEHIESAIIEIVEMNENSTKSD